MTSSSSRDSQSVQASRSDIRAITGLTAEEVDRRIREEGPNELATTKPRTWLTIAWDVVREPMLLLLLAAGSLNFLLGEPQDGFILLSFVIVVIAITFFQERRTERALEALRDLSSPRALVLRDGVQTRIAGRDVVRGDVVLLAEGDRVPADGVLLECVNLSVDESLLTGESVPVRKFSAEGEVDMGPPGGDDTPYVFAGTLVVNGQGICVVRATGGRAELGKIGAALSEVKSERTRLQREVGRVVRNVLVIGLVLCAVVVVVYGLTRNDWLKGALAGITLAMAMLPEEFPVVLTVFLAIGAWRLSQKHVLVRRMPVVETLGSTTVLCVDKTGTLTQNRMTVKDLVVDGNTCEIDDNSLTEQFHPLAEYAVLASPVDPFDPMDAAFKQLGIRHLAGTEHLHADWVLVREYPLSDHLMALSHVWRSPDGTEFVIAAKGAPEAIADLCHLSSEQRAALDRNVSEVADRGRRVLGVARATFSAATGLPAEQHDFDFEFVGLVGLQDPVREFVPHAVAEAGRAGIRVVMITGDYPGTATSIAREIGLMPCDRYLTGPELATLSDEELSIRIAEVSIFARMVPAQKLRIVRALQARGEVVAMTGDGVNDAPALKAADIGIAMGSRGTDVAREAAGVVLTDDDFSSIVGAVRQGRRAYDNLRKAMAYIVAVHVPIAGMSLIPVVADKTWPLVLLPMHIAFLELIIDPACSVVFEAEGEESNLMERPPRAPEEPLFTRHMVGISLLQGASVLAAVFAVYFWTLSAGHAEEEVRTLAFTTLVIGNLGLIAVNRSWTQGAVADLVRVRNSAFGWVVGGSVLFLGLVLTVPVLRDLFRFAPVHPGDVMWAIAAGLSGVLWFEAYKLRRHGAAGRPGKHRRRREPE
jgi:Ca2+-transporting ATPase